MPRPAVAMSALDPVIGCQDPIRSLHGAPVDPRSRGSAEKIAQIRLSRNGERDSGVWLVRTSGRQPGAELGSLAREYARFPPNFARGLVGNGAIRA
jgi:hypothetical protein